MSADRELYRDKIEVSLDGKQLFYLFFGAAVIATVVFVLGVMVGRRLEARTQPDGATALEMASSDPLAALDLLAAGPGADDLSFPSALRESAPSAPPTAAKVVESDADEEAAEKKAADAKAAEAEAAAEKKAVEAAAEAARKRAAETAAAAEKAVAAAASAKQFTLQLSSFRDESEADAFYARLTSAGYQPYIIRADVDGTGTWFRVRVGRYATFDEALAAKAEFEKSQHIIAYVTRLPRS